MKYFCFCQGDVLLTQEQRVPLDIISLHVNPWNLVTQIEWYGTKCQIVRLDYPVSNEEFMMMNLRKSFGVLSHEDYQLAGKCAELLYWDSNTKYCGCCGAPMKWDTEISKKCTHCGKELWPQLAPAIIVRVVKDDEILMVRAHNFRSDHYGLVAGFVETGETLEECVCREVREEVGLEIDDIQYFGSQPWPYPCGLMIGFTARYVSGEITMQRSELCDAGWFTRDKMPKYPDAASIAGVLVRDWLQIS